MDGWVGMVRVAHLYRVCGSGCGCGCGHGSGVCGGRSSSRRRCWKVTITGGKAMIAASSGNISSARSSGQCVRAGSE
eukprot:96079-Prorocentrum_lima.AAC.1